MAPAGALPPVHRECDAVPKVGVRVIVHKYLATAARLHRPPQFLRPMVKRATDSGHRCATAGPEVDRHHAARCRGRTRESYCPTASSPSTSPPLVLHGTIPHWLSRRHVLDAMCCAALAFTASKGDSSIDRRHHPNRVKATDSYAHPARAPRALDTSSGWRLGRDSGEVGESCGPECWLWVWSGWRLVPRRLRRPSTTDPSRTRG